MASWRDKDSQDEAAMRCARNEWRCSGPLSGRRRAEELRALRMLAEVCKREESVFSLPLYVRVCESPVSCRCMQAVGWV